MSRYTGNIYNTVNRRPTLYDGLGNPTKPYTTGQSKYQINRRFLSFHALFYTQEGGYDAYYTLGRRDDSVRDRLNHIEQYTRPENEQEFAQELMGFDTQNTGSRNIPTMQITLFPYRDWEQILAINDYVAVQVDEMYPDDPYWKYEYHSDYDTLYDSKGVKRRTLMCGLISDIQFSEDTQSGRGYVITCQGLQKVLNDIYLGLPQTAQNADANLLFDINGDSNPANEQFPFYSGGGASPSQTSKSSKQTGGGSYGLSGDAGKIAKFFSGKGCNKTQIAAILGNSQLEAGGMPGDHNLFGISTNNQADNYTQKWSDEKQCQTIWDSGFAPKWKSQTSNYSVSKAAVAWRKEVEQAKSGGVADASRISFAQNWYKKMK